ncbi:MAG: hypothetical protein M1113_02605 [Candidatus Thermoplasmatota archaeon]|nr:hypothetical protein [Candidatus Thermoplasmatota archaeon]
MSCFSKFAIRSPESHLKIRNDTPDLRFRSIASRILVDLLKEGEKIWTKVINALPESIRSHTSLQWV